MIDSEMFWLTEVNQAVVTAPATRVNSRFNPDASVNNGLQRFLLNIWDNLGEHFSVSFVDAEDNDLAACAATAFAFDLSGSEVGLTSPAK